MLAVEICYLKVAFVIYLKVFLVQTTTVQYMRRCQQSVYSHSPKSQCYSTSCYFTIYTRQLKNDILRKIAVSLKESGTDTHFRQL